MDRRIRTIEETEPQDAPRQGAKEGAENAEVHEHSAAQVHNVNIFRPISGHAQILTIEP